MRAVYTIKFFIMIGVYDVYIGAKYNLKKEKGVYAFTISGNKTIQDKGELKTKQGHILPFVCVLKACRKLPADAKEVTFHLEDKLTYQTLSGQVAIKNWRKPLMNVFSQLTSRLTVDVERDSAYMDHQYIKNILQSLFDKPIKACKACVQKPTSKTASDVKKINHKYILYTDGSCSDNRTLSSGGYAYVLLDDNGKCIKKYSEGFDKTTNNRMELSAIINGCKQLEDGSYVTVFSDSQYALYVLSGKWKATKNTDLIAQHEADKKRLHIAYEWVKGHDGNKYNEICDKMAKAVSSHTPSEVKKEKIKAPQSLKSKKTAKKNDKVTLLQNNAEYFVYTTTETNYGRTACAYSIYDKKGELVERNTFLRTMAQSYSSQLEVIVEAMHHVPECSVNVLVVSDCKYPIFIYNGTFHAHKNFDIIQQQYENEKNWHIDYVLVDEKLTEIKTLKLLANKAIADANGFSTRKNGRAKYKWVEEEQDVNDDDYVVVPEPDPYQIAFFASEPKNDKVVCCYAIRNPDGTLTSKAFLEPVDMSDTETTLKTLAMIILVEAYKAIPEDSDIDIYSESCFDFLANIYAGDGQQAYEANDYLAMQMKYTKSGDERRVKVINQHQSRLSHCIERCLNKNKELL